VLTMKECTCLTKKSTRSDGSCLSQGIEFPKYGLLKPTQVQDEAGSFSVGGSGEVIPLINEPIKSQNEEDSNSGDYQLNDKDSMFDDESSDDGSTCRTTRTFPRLAMKVLSLTIKAVSLTMALVGHPPKPPARWS